MTVGSGLFSKEAPDHPHLVGADGGLSGEIKDVRDDLKKVFTPLAAITIEEFTNPALAVANAIKLAIASVAAPVTYSGAALDGSVGAGAMSPPRNITILTAGVTPADAPATATINGLDIDGKVLSEVITVAQTNTTAVGVKAFAKVTSIVLPAADGVAATLAFGFGTKIGLSKTIKTRAGAANLIREVAVGTLVTNGVMATAAIGAPHGTYTPNTVPDGANDYCIYYEFDPYG